jgi:hypothetical protein
VILKTLSYFWVAMNYFSRLIMAFNIAKMSAASRRNNGIYKLGAYHIGSSVPHLLFDVFPQPASSGRARSSISRTQWASSID